MSKYLNSSTLRSTLLMGGLLTMVLAFTHWGIGDVMANSLIDPSIQPGNLQGATGGEQSLTALVRTMLNYFLGFLGILALAIVIYGGFMYVTAGVNESGAETGKKVLTYAAIGIIVILLSFVIVNTLLSAATPGAVQ